MPSFRGSSYPRDWTHISYGSCVSRQFLYPWATWEVHLAIVTQSKIWICYQLYSTIKKTNVICRGKKILGCLRLQMGGSQCHRREQGILGIAEILVGLLLTRIVYICQNPIKMCMVLYINYTSIKLMAKKPIVYRSNNTRQKHVNNLLFIGKGS